MTDLSVVKQWGRETYSALDKGQKTDRTNNMKSLKRLLLNARGMAPYNKIWKELHLLKMGRIKLNLTFTLSSYKNLNWLKALRSFLYNFSRFEASEITVKCKKMTVCPRTCANKAILCWWKSVIYDTKCRLSRFLRCFVEKLERQQQYLDE